MKKGFINKALVRMVPYLASAIPMVVIFGLVWNSHGLLWGTVTYVSSTLVFGKIFDAVILNKEEEN